MSEKEQLYDEFGNYIGPEDFSDSSEETSSSVSEDSKKQKSTGSPAENTTTKTKTAFASPGPPGNAGITPNKGETPRSGVEKMQIETVNVSKKVTGTEIVLQEDKEYYPSAGEVYPGAEIMTQLEDTQPIEQPIIAPVKNRLFSLIEKTMPETTFSFKFLAKTMENPLLVRNLCFLGQLHHGKTLFMDMLVKETHIKDWPLDIETRYTDTGKDEQNRGIGIKSSPISLVLQNLSDKSFLLNMMDCPGHVNFSDEMTAGIRISDGAVIFIDAVEGVMNQTARSIRHAVEQNLSVALVFTKMDRLVLELKIPPRDAYHKLVGMIKEVNELLESLDYKDKLSPERGNICFSSALFGFSFTLTSFVRVSYGMEGNEEIEMVSKLWGNFYFDKKNNSFVAKPPFKDSKRTFVEFVLEPLYKIFSVLLSSEPKELTPFLESLGVNLKKRYLQSDAKVLIKLVCEKFFRGSAGFVEMVSTCFPNPKEAAFDKAKKIYTGDLQSECGKLITSCSAFLPGGAKRAPAMINIVKIYPRPDCSSFDAFGRVFSGVVRKGDSVRVLREGYSLDDEEDMCVKTIEDIWIFQGRYRVSINQVPAGNWALFSGISSGITKTATVTHLEGNEEACIFSPLMFNTISVFKLAIEPLKPSELPKMLEALRHINNTYPLSLTKVEESGEHVILGTGELYLDCIMHDLREKYSDIEIKVADPVVRFSETVLETSSIPCFSKTPNEQNKLTMICEPLDPRLAGDIENGLVDIKWNKEKLAEALCEKYGWDALEARSVWAFGPNSNGPNIFMDETIPGEVDKDKLSSIKGNIIQGFQWGAKEGPLCDEPIRNCCFKLVEAEISDNSLHRGGGQIIPTTRRVAYSAFLLATPRLMEPIYFVEIQAPIDCIAPIYNVLGLRRGFVISETPKPGTPIFVIHAHIPVIDSFGFETDLRTHTQGQAFCTSVFDHWEQVPGDPLDKTVELKPLEPAPPNGLAREFVKKTRMRKGLEEEVTAYKYFDDAMSFALAEHEAENEEE